jgi:hypothetical protein
VIAHISRKKGYIQCKTVIYDQYVGPAKAFFAGKLIKKHANLRLIGFRSAASRNSLTGQVILDFDPDFLHAIVKWNTDIGTQETCERAAKICFTRWWVICCGSVRLIILKQGARQAHLPDICFSDS